MLSTLEILRKAAALDCAHVEIRCEVCGQLHKVDSTGYVTLHGQILKGIGGGLLGGAPDEDGKEYISMYCADCFMIALADYFGVDLSALHYKVEKKKKPPINTLDF